MDPFKAYVKQILPYAKFKRSEVNFPAQSTAVLATQFIEAGAIPQDSKWCPVSAETALKDFGDPKEEGAYYLQVVLEDDLCEFRINSAGTTINYV